MTGPTNRPFFRHPREMSPLLKFACMLSCVATAYVARDIRAILAVVLVEGAVAAAFGAFRAFRLTLLALLVGAGTLCLFQIFTIREGTIVFYLIPPLKAGAITDAGLESCLVMAARMIASVASIPLMLSLTSQTHVVSLVSGSFRLPGAYSIMLVTALRFIPTFGDRMRMVLQAEASRGYTVDSGNPLRKIGMVLRLSLPLLVSCARDVDTLALSIETRGFDPRNASRPRTIAPTAGDAAALAAFLATMVSIVAADRFIF